MRLIPLLLLPALVLAGCDGDDDGTGDAADGTTTTAAETTTTTTGDGGVPLLASCTNPEVGYEVDYPDGWNTNSGDVVPECSFFDPFPFEVPEGTDAIPAAITVRAEPVAIERVTAESPAREIREREELTVDGHDAVLLHTESTGEALLPEGTESLVAAVDLGEASTLVASTHELPGHAFDYNQRVLRAMIETLDLPDGGAAG